MTNDNLLDSSSSGASAVVDIFNIQTMSWSSTSTGAGSLSVARAGLSAAAAGELIAFAGGSNGTSYGLLLLIHHSRHFTDSQRLWTYIMLILVLGAPAHFRLRGNLWLLPERASKLSLLVECTQGAVVFLLTITQGTR